MKHTSGRIVGVFGLPCSGKTTIIRALVQSSREILAHISTGDIARKLSTEEDKKHMSNGNLYPLEDKMREEILQLVIKRRGQGSEVIFLDSCPRFDEQVQWMLDNQLAGEGAGILIKIEGDHLYERAKLRMRDDQDELDKLEKKIKTQQQLIDGMEKVIFRYGIPYHTIMNTDVVHATTQLSKIVGIRK
jgi:adenylate kinase family enzyme